MRRRRVGEQGGREDTRREDDFVERVKRLKRGGRREMALEEKVRKAKRREAEGD